jgi:hypothetical protein
MRTHIVSRGMTIGCNVFMVSQHNSIKCFKKKCSWWWDRRGLYNGTRFLYQELSLTQDELTHWRHKLTMTGAFFTRSSCIGHILNLNREGGGVSHKMGLGEHAALLGRGFQNCCHLCGCLQLLEVLCDILKVSLPHQSHREQMIRNKFSSFYHHFFTIKNVLCVFKYTAYSKNLHLSNCYKSEIRRTHFS